MTGAALKLTALAASLAVGFVVLVQVQQNLKKPQKNSLNAAQSQNLNELNHELLDPEDVRELNNSSTEFNDPFDPELSSTSLESAPSFNSADYPQQAQDFNFAAEDAAPGQKFSRPAEQQVSQGSAPVEADPFAEFTAELKEKRHELAHTAGQVQQKFERGSEKLNADLDQWESQMEQTSQRVQAKVEEKLKNLPPRQAELLQTVAGTVEGIIQPVTGIEDAESPAIQQAFAQRPAEKTPPKRFDAFDIDDIPNAVAPSLGTFGSPAGSSPKPNPLPNLFPGPEAASSTPTAAPLKKNSFPVAFSDSSEPSENPEPPVNAEPPVNSEPAEPSPVAEKPAAPKTPEKKTEKKPAFAGFPGFEPEETQSAVGAPPTAQETPQLPVITSAPRGFPPSQPEAAEQGMSSSDGGPTITPGFSSMSISEAQPAEPAAENNNRPAPDAQPESQSSGSPFMMNEPAEAAPAQKDAQPSVPPKKSGSFFEEFEPEPASVPETGSAPAKPGEKHGAPFQFSDEPAVPAEKPAESPFGPLPESPSPPKMSGATDFAPEEFVPGEFVPEAAEPSMKRPAAPGFDFPAEPQPARKQSPFGDSPADSTQFDNSVPGFPTMMNVAPQQEGDVPPAQPENSEPAPPSEPEQKPEPEPESQSESKPEPKAEPKPEPKPEPTPAPAEEPPAQPENNKPAPFEEMPADSAAPEMKPAPRTNPFGDFDPTEEELPPAIPLQPEPMKPEPVQPEPAPEKPQPNPTSDDFPGMPAPREEAPFQPEPGRPEPAKPEPAPVRPNPLNSGNSQQDLMGSAELEDTQAPAESVLQPKVELYKSAPENAVLGQPLIYSIEIVNTGEVTVKEVTVEDQFPAGTKLTGTIPRAELVEKTLVWKFPELKPGERKKILVRVVPVESGKIGSVSTVAYKSTVAAQTMVTAPKLALSATVVDEVSVGEPVQVHFVVANTGSGEARDVILRNLIPEGLEHPAGNDLEYEVGLLRGGESKKVTLTLTTKAVGTFTNDASLRASGGETAELSTAIKVIPSAMTLKRTGPTRRFVGQAAEYDNTLINNTQRVLRNITVTEQLPEGFEFHSASENGQFDPRRGTITWFFANLPAGEELQVSSRLIPRQLGTRELIVTAQDEAGHTAEVSAETKVEGFTSLVVRSAEERPPIAVGERTSLRFKVVNRGTAEATRVVVRCQIPAQLQYLSSNGPAKGVQKGEFVEFEALKQLAPEREAVFDLVFTGQQAGDARLNFEVTADQISSPLKHQEQIIIYAE